MLGRSCDVIVIGGGPNGLAAATRLAQAGRRVVVLDPGPGGSLVGTGDLTPGTARPALSHLVAHLDPRVEAGMGLLRHGLTWATTQLPTAVLGPDPLVLTGPAYASAQDPAWPALRRKLLALAAALEPFRRLPPPALSGMGAGKFLKPALGLRALGAADFRELLRMVLINVHDVVTDELSDPRLRAVVCLDATLGAWLGPRSPNSLILLLDRLAGQVAGTKGGLGVPEGGMPALAAAMLRAAQAAGVVVRTARVAGIDVEADRATGVTLADGTSLRAEQVLSTLGPKTTLLSLLGAGHLDIGLTTRLRQIKARGGAAKLHLALRAMPEMPVDPRARLVLARDEQAVETAFNPAKYGETPGRPVMEITFPHLWTGGPPVLSAVVQHAPFAPKDPDAARTALLEASLGELEQAMPGLRAQVGAAELWLPQDIAARSGLEGGCWHQAELSVEQMLFLRPLPELAHYRTPVRNLWMGGAGNHPGGGVSGAAGWTAAGEMLA